MGLNEPEQPGCHSDQNQTPCIRMRRGNRLGARRQTSSHSHPFSPWMIVDSSLLNLPSRHFCLRQSGSLFLVCGFSALRAEKPHTEVLPQAEYTSNAGHRVTRTNDNSHKPCSRDCVSANDAHYSSIGSI